ncbi:hypothetical protein SCLCIDRAFT_28298 [Scleroderma citrinum Foug A]|uniref:Uncharacterized protein n=1 Tax=Scleroderma citrinum Foug A TaxID=1036808 RepID=A0A0C2Z871_9AGAM|nr:hypothetical protein SCLCIDRAFT_28298 [Scleroderma citrinum Foug A]
MSNLPQYPRLQDHVNTSQVGVLDFQRSTNVSRFRFDMTVSTAGSMDPMELFGSVWRWLRKSDTSVMLDFELYRFDLDSIASLPQSIDLQASLRCVSAWLSGPGTSLMRS